MILALQLTPTYIHTFNNNYPMAAQLLSSIRRSNPLKKKGVTGSNSTTPKGSSSSTPSKVFSRLKSLNKSTSQTTDISTTTESTTDSQTANTTAVAAAVPSSSLDYLDGEPLNNIPESSVHIDDSSESGSAQVNLVNDSSPTNNREIVNDSAWCCGVNDVINTLGLSGANNIEYNDDNVINNNNGEAVENRDELDGIEVEKAKEDQLRDTNMKQQLNNTTNEKKTATSGSKQPTAGGSDDITQSTTGGSSKKKSRMGSIFSKKGNKKGGDKEEEEQPPNDNNGDDKKDDEDEDKDKKKKSPTRRISSLTTFSTERQKFALQSTLPIHTGSEQSAPKSSPSWTPVNGTEFKVRHGPNYTKTGKKDNSLESLYDVYCVRFYRSEKRTKGGATRIMPLPGVVEGDNESVAEGGGDEVKANGDETAGDKAAAAEGEDVDDLTRRMSIEDTTTSSTGGKHYPELDGTKVPDVLVVHFMLPYEPPNMFKQKDDGPGGECVYYLKPSQRFLDEISGRIPKTPATTLFINWCNECESNFQMRSRFKCMALVRDIDKHNFGLLKSYNGKPVLITESGRASSGYHGDVRYLEMTANGKFVVVWEVKFNS